MEQKKDFFLYKDRPLVRCGNTIYYGSMGDEYVVYMQINDSETVNDLPMSKSISVKLMSTDPTKNPLESIVRTGERDGLYPALDLANTWLTDMEKKKRA